MRGVEVLACEDTRNTRKFLSLHGITPPRLLSCHEHNEEKTAAFLLKCLEEKKIVGLVSDAGMPGISDPGYRVIQAVLREGFGLSVLPGPSSVQTALLLSGFSSSGYTFKGFSPRKSGARKKFLEADQESSHTLIFFESLHRLEKFLEAAYAVYGERNAAVCAELTKKNERVYRGTLKNILENFSRIVLKGEFTLVIEGKKAPGKETKRRDFQIDLRSDSV